MGLPTIRSEYPRGHKAPRSAARCESSRKALHPLGTPPATSSPLAPRRALCHGAPSGSRDPGHAVAPLALAYV
jgi:hypothetical protein